MEDETSIKADGYRYLDDAPLEVFIREFLLRNDEFLREVSDFAKNALGGYTDELFQEKEKLVRKYGVEFAGNLSQPFRDSLRIDIGWSVWATRIVPDDDKQELDRIRQAAQQGKKRSWDYYSSSNVEEGTEYYYSTLDQMLPQSPIPPNLLIMSINLDRTRENIEKEINELLNIHKVKTKKRSWLNKWKYYLAAYDLHEKHGIKNYERLANNLQDLFPDADITFDADTAENYYKKARDLIAGEYKMYVCPR